MKIYVYDSATGIYQGEDFCDETFRHEDVGTLPEGATTLAPPIYEKGEVAVFDREARKWELRRLSLPLSG